MIIKGKISSVPQLIKMKSLHVNNGFSVIIKGPILYKTHLTNVFFNNNMLCQWTPQK